MEVAQSAKYLFHMPEGLSLTLRTHGRRGKKEWWYDPVLGEQRQENEAGGEGADGLAGKFQANKRQCPNK